MLRGAEHSSATPIPRRSTAAMMPPPGRGGTPASPQPPNGSSTAPPLPKLVFLDPHQSRLTVAGSSPHPWWGRRTSQDHSQVSRWEAGPRWRPSRIPLGSCPSLPLLPPCAGCRQQRITRWCAAGVTRSALCVSNGLWRAEERGFEFRETEPQHQCHRKIEVMVLQIQRVAGTSGRVVAAFLSRRSVVVLCTRGQTEAHSRATPQESTSGEPANRQVQ